MFSIDYREIGTWQRRKTGEFSHCAFMILILNHDLSDQQIQLHSNWYLKGIRKQKQNDFFVSTTNLCS